jgi:NADPH:quinone reductase-like Zn-dependent oxidoreductase
MRTLLLAIGFAASAAMASGDMLAVRMHGTGGPEALRVERIAIPQPAAGEVRIKVRAAGVNPVDWKIRERGFGRTISAQNPWIPGFDVAGTIDAIGEGVTAWRPGEAVIASLQRAAQGGYAEYAIASAEDVARAPARWSAEEAAGLPTVGTTVWRYLILAGGLKEGEHLLVQGGAGGVGSVAVQVARARGARVTATASARNADYLRSIGADTVIDYRAAPFEQSVSGVDVVFDTVGGETLARSVAVVRPGGRLITIAGRPDMAACGKARITCIGGGPQPGAYGGQLAEIVALADSGKLSLNIDRVFPLEQAAQAQELNRAGRTRGKIVLRTSR